MQSNTINPMTETAACDSYIHYCRSLSQRINNNDLPNDLRAFAVKQVCDNYELFNGIAEKYPKPFARLFIMNLADFDFKNGRYETEISNQELKDIYLEWHSRHLEELASN